MAIQAVHCNPPLSIARLGGSSVPMQAFSWSQSDDPHIIGETQIKPEWTLMVESDGSLTPVMPTEIVLKDNGQLRPVAPFVELWCDVGDDGDEENWVRQPLTKSLLSAHGLNASNITFSVSAVNAKPARRTGNLNLRYGTARAVTVRGGEHQSKPLLGVSLAPAGESNKMIPPGRNIPLGSIQMIRPGDQPPAEDGVVWAEHVNIETIRLRITPAKGLCYGPPGTADPIEPEDSSRGFSAVNPGDDFLDPDAGWTDVVPRRVALPGSTSQSFVDVPWDTYDGAEKRPFPGSIGIVDDTCEIEIRVRLDQSPINRADLSARGSVFCGPPDYAPDRRPFLSLADSLGDRLAGNAARSATLTDKELDRWVEDLFERAFETVSLMNVDIWRRVRASNISPAKQRPAPIPDDETRDPTRAFGAFDALRDSDIELPAPSANTPLPVHTRAHERHRDLSDIVALKRFIRENPDRFEALIRRPFFSASEENRNATTMQMPPFMRNSNAEPLTLSVWQYDLLMEWQRRVLSGPVSIEEEGGFPTELSAASESRRAQVLERLSNSVGEF